MAYLIGADPEVFVTDKNNQFVSAFNMVPGDKANPYPVPFGAVQVDGMALEFNIEPASTRQEFIHNVTNVYDTLKQMVPEYNLHHVPVADFDPSYFETCDPSSKVLGCDPDYNAWTGVANNPPQGERPFRTASGHVHIGWTTDADPFSEEHFADCRTVVQQLDYALGIPSQLYDTDKRRRSMYGDFGAFRPKSYGVEYRVLSNAWLASEELMGWVYDNTQIAMTDLENGVRYSNKCYKPHQYTKDGDIRYIMNHYLKNLKLPPLAKAA